MKTIFAVEYLNTLPLLQGLIHSGLEKKYIVQLGSPVECVQAFQQKKADIVLLPVGALDQLGEAFIFSNYCIGCEGKVATVALYSHVPLHEIQNIVLDPSSRTSNLLVKLLVREYWKIPLVEFVQNGESNSERTAKLVIGDKSFEMDDKYLYKYDLGEEWFHWKKLPFVFAVWVSAQPLDEATIQQFNEAFSWGVAHVDQISINHAHISHQKLQEYYSRYISYSFDAEKKHALRLFLSLSGIPFLLPVEDSVK